VYDAGSASAASDGGASAGAAVGVGTETVGAVTGASGRSVELQTRRFPLDLGRNRRLRVLQLLHPQARYCGERGPSPRQSIGESRQPLERHQHAAAEDFADEQHARHEQHERPDRGTDYLPVRRQDGRRLSPNAPGRRHDLRTVRSPRRPRRRAACRGRARLAGVHCWRGVRTRRSEGHRRPPATERRQNRRGSKGSSCPALRPESSPRTGPGRLPPTAALPPRRSAGPASAERDR
jgi:hypothetical protein